MKKFVTLMLMLCMATACAVMFSACEKTVYTVTEEEWSNALSFEEDFVMELGLWENYVWKPDESFKKNSVAYKNLIWEKDSDAEGEADYYEMDEDALYRYHFDIRDQMWNWYEDSVPRSRCDTINVKWWLAEFKAKFSEFAFDEETKTYYCETTNESSGNAKIKYSFYFENAKVCSFGSYSEFLVTGSIDEKPVGDYNNRVVCKFTYESRPFELPDLGNVVNETAWDNAVDIQGNFVIGSRDSLVSFYNNIVEIDYNLHYEKDGDNYYKYEYSGRDENRNNIYTKSKISQEEFDAIRKEYNLASALKGKFSEFENVGSYRDYKYICDKVTINGQEFSDVEVTFASGKLHAFRGTINKGTENEEKFAYSCSYYVVNISLPDGERDIVIPEDDFYTVTEEEWNKAVSLEDNFIMNISSDNENITIYFYDNKINHIVEKNGERVEYYYEQDGEIYYLYYKENNEWKKREIEEEEFNRFREPLRLLYGKYGDFSYNASDKSYYCASVEAGEKGTITDVKAKFYLNYYNGIKKLTALECTDYNGLHGTIIFTYESVNFELPRINN